MLFSFDHEHRLNVLGACLGLPSGRVDELLWQSGFSASCDAGRYRDAAAVRARIRRITGYGGPDKRLDAAWLAPVSRIGHQDGSCIPSGQPRLRAHNEEARGLAALGHVEGGGARTS